MNKWRALFSIDVRALAALRIATGFLAIVDIFQRCANLTAHYTDAGIFPRAAFLNSWWDPWRFSLLLASGNAWFVFLCALATCFFALRWMAGYQTRASGFLLWAFLLSWQWRLPLAMHGGDALLLFIIFWGAFLPSGAAWSADAHASNQRPTSPRVCNIATVALLTQVVLMYVCSAIFKIRWSGWLNGDAIYFCTNADFWTTPLGHVLFRFPSCFALLSKYIVAIEFFAPVILFSPWATRTCRWLAIAALGTLQVGIGLLLYMGLFPIISMAAMIPFLPDSFWNWIEKRTRACLPKAWQTYWNTLTPTRASPFTTGQLSAIVGLCWTAMLWFNAWTLYPRLYYPSIVSQFVRLMAFDHRWNLFSDPAVYDGWPILAGKLRNGNAVDLLRGGQPVLWEYPLQAGSLYADARWRIFMWSYVNTMRPNVRGYLPQYYCQQWNMRHAGPMHLDELSVYYMRRLVLPRGNTIAPEKILLSAMNCPA